MQHRVLVALTTLSKLASLGNAQAFSYVEAVVTECDADDDTYETDAATQAVTTAPAELGTCSYTMPTCDCGCPTCTFTSVYSTSYPILCPTGVSDQTYTITETYVGMSSLMVWPTPTTTPYGFTTSEATCTACGDSPVTTVITCPSGGSTYHDSATATQEAPATDEPTTYTTSTQYITRVHTITSCAPTVTNCPVGSVTTEIDTTVTVCPVTASAGSNNATGHYTAGNSASPSGSHSDDAASYAVSSAASVATGTGANSAYNTAAGTAAQQASADDVDTSTVTRSLSAVPAAESGQAAQSAAQSYAAQSAAQSNAAASAAQSYAAQSAVENNAAASYAQGNSAATKGTNAASPATHLPVTVSGASKMSSFLAPIVFVVGLIAAQLA